MRSKVYFYKNLDELKSGTNKFIEMISKELGEDNIGLKIHFGEGNNDTHIDPELLKDVTKYFNNPKFVECNVLYKGTRTRKSDHIETAKKHGFGFLEIDILDGELGEEAVEVPINTPNTKFAKLGKGLEKYGKLIALTHFKGHGMSGFGGAIKNVGMGLGSRGGKLDMHSSLSPQVNRQTCIACKVCIENCPADAIKLVENKAGVNQDKCIGCAMCIAVCPTGAISSVPHESKRLMEKVVEYTLAATKNKEWWYINFLTNITYLCDCKGGKQKPFMKDIGILMSKDPVAIDKASIDLVIKYNEGNEPFENKHGVEGSYILDYAEELGLGTQDYELIEIE
ncbi:MAG: DUF362 domain-containing protein [Candidatus Aenigmarchaeota archaeon]|nr:DUF362 domain-containing protein [Candidatus Aenigmarchaeota archaeon]